MSKGKKGSRHPLLLYRHFWSRIWKATLTLAVVLVGIWVLAEYFRIDLLGLQARPWVLLGALASLLFTIVALLARRLSYVQVCDDHLRVVTPFFPVRFSFRRVITSRASGLVQVFPPQDSNWARRRFLDPYYGYTVMIVEFKGSPLPPSILRAFLSGYVFLDDPPRLVLVVEDWMKLSTELDSFMGAWRQAIAHQRHIKKRGRPY